MSNGCSKCKRSTDERCPLIFRFIIRLHDAEVSRLGCPRTSLRTKSRHRLLSENTKRQSRLAPLKFDQDEWHSRDQGNSHSTTDSRRTTSRSMLNHSAAIGTPPSRRTCLALRSDVFFSLNGFLNWPLLEDYDFVKRLRKIGPIMIAKTPATPATPATPDRDEPCRGAVRMIRRLQPGRRAHSAVVR